MRTDSYPRYNGSILSVIAIIALIASYLFFRPEPSVNNYFTHFALFNCDEILFSNNALSLVLGITFLLLISISILYISTFIYGQNPFTSLLFLVLALSNPSSLYFSPIHIVSLLFLWGTFLSVIYKLEDGNNNERIFLSFFIYSIGILFFPPMIWSIPALIIVNINSTDNKLKFIFSIIIDTLTPFVISAAIQYLIGGWDQMSISIQSYLQAFIDLKERHIAMSSPLICKLLIITILTIISIVYCIKNRINFTKSKSTLLNRLFFYVIITISIVLVFLQNVNYPFGVLLYAPISFLLFEISAIWNKKGWFSIYYSLFLLLLIIERLSIIL